MSGKSWGARFRGELASGLYLTEPEKGEAPSRQVGIVSDVADGAKVLAALDRPAYDVGSAVLSSSEAAGSFTGLSGVKGAAGAVDGAALSASAGRSMEALDKVKAVDTLGTALTVASVGAAVYASHERNKQLLKAGDPAKTANYGGRLLYSGLRELGTGLAGDHAGALGAKGGAVLGAKLGAAVGVWFGGIGAPVGAAIGAAVGGIVGYFAAKKLTEAAIGATLDSIGIDEEAAGRVAEGAYRLAAKARDSLEDAARRAASGIAGAAAMLRDKAVSKARSLLSEVRSAFEKLESEFEDALVGAPCVPCLAAKIGVPYVDGAAPPPPAAPAKGAQPPVSVDVAAQLSADAYNDESQPDQIPPGWKRIEQTSDEDSGFFAAVYRNEQTGQTVVAYRGTQPSSGADWWADIKQGLGYETEQYDEAILVARDAKDRYGDVEFVGHSLGGGLAATASAVTGDHATTFNAAGVHANTLARAGVLPEDATNIDNHYVKGEVLSTLQNSTGLPDALGTQHAYEPKDSLGTAAWGAGGAFAGGAVGAVALGRVAGPAGAVVGGVAGTVGGAVAGVGIQRHLMGSVMGALGVTPGQTGTSPADGGAR